ncbi:oxidation resistance protein 1-like isoform X1 [Arachis ipaensis]|uniref:oxidation resistance protein 1-like isoform X1 n=1 Tax=Arachis ipaensis TaxID=130454 RepID=UPI0007AF669E|nr:oxidation resistance protein 1-like isoform X1 [Arachis ipaensis]XP_025672341.1 oxidation resistance protein 1-like isoform X1 [Arachis hypogaea]
MDWFQMLVITFQVVGDQRGAVFGSLVEAPLRPSNKKYQGTNSTFVFTNISGHPVIYRPTGLTRYFTLCNSEFLAIGGGSHFAVYLDGDLLNGSRSVSETYENPCLANSQDFEVKEVEVLMQLLRFFSHAHNVTHSFILSFLSFSGC